MVGGIFTRLRSPLRFFGDTRGVSAVEFALILPVMITMYLGCNEVGNGLTIARKVTHLTSTLADLVTQSKNTITESEMCNILATVASIMAPYGTAPLKIRLSEYDIDVNKKVTVGWSSAYNDTPLAKNAVIGTLPTNIKTASTHLITAEVHYPYTPTIGYVLTGTFDVHDQFYLSPRLSEAIDGPQLTLPAPGKCGQPA